VFEKVCGLALENAAIVTTRWDVVGYKKAVELQKELVTGERYFKPLCQAGATTFGHDNTRESAQRVMNMLLNNNPIVLQMQEELAKPGTTLEQTAAGSQLSAHLDAISRKHEADMKNLREEMEGALKEKDEALQDLMYEIETLKEDMKRLSASRVLLEEAPPKLRVFERFMLAVLLRFNAKRVREPTARGSQDPGLTRSDPDRSSSDLTLINGS